MYDSLYIHIPFCVTKCDYCSFYSVDSLELFPSYLDRLDQELAVRAERSASLRSVFLGGGTPNAADPQSLERLLGLVHRHFALADDCEFTMESNPASYTPEKLLLARSAGVNRFSLGVQSFSNEHRKAIGRCGSLSACLRTLERIVESGDRFSCDMIFGLPEQTVEDWRQELKQLMSYKPTHVSAYSLTVDPETPLAGSGAVPADEERFIAMWQAATDVLGEQGLYRYEISNFAKPGCECRHNMEIWHGHAFAGAGPAAHWFDGTSRWSNPPSLGEWLKGAEPLEDRIPDRDRAVEILITGLRTTAGWSRRAFTASTGYDYMDLREAHLRQLASAGLLTISDHSIAPTEKGLLLNDSIGYELW